MSSPDDDRRRRRDAKRFNKRLDLITSLLNTSAAALFAATFLVPAITQVGIFNDPWRWFWFTLGLVLHGTAHLVLTLHRSEE